MKNRVRTQGKLRHQKRQHSNSSNNPNISKDHSNKAFEQQKNDDNNNQLIRNDNNNYNHNYINNSNNSNNNSNQMMLNTASNNELKEIISKLIAKSRSLIISLEKTLKELDFTRGEKEFWKGHYMNFKTACERYIKSRGIAPFQYMSPIFDNNVFVDSNGYFLRLSPQHQQQQQSDSQYRSSSLNNCHFNNLYNNKPVHYFNNNNNNTATIISPSKQYIKQISTPNNNSKIPSPQKQPTQQQTHSPSSANIKTITKTVDDEIFSPSHEQFFGVKRKDDQNFKGIKLGKGKDKIQMKVSPIKLHIYDTRSKNNSNYRRKDSLQTKRVSLFSFVRNKNPQSQQDEVKIN